MKNPLEKFCAGCDLWDVPDASRTPLAITVETHASRFDGLDAEEGKKAVEALKKYLSRFFPEAAVSGCGSCLMRRYVSKPGCMESQALDMENGTGGRE